MCPSVYPGCLAAENVCAGRLSAAAQTGAAQIQHGQRGAGGTECESDINSKMCRNNSNTCKCIGYVSSL